MADVSFESDIKPLFRDKDQRAMNYAFDLHSYDAVKEHADGIFTRIENGTMPCDGAWSAEQIEVFRSWKDGGMAP